MERAETFEKFVTILRTQGVVPALRFLNSRTTHRFTAMYRFDDPVLRNLRLVDSYDPLTVRGDDAVFVETYCALVGRDERTFATADAREDPRLAGHAAREKIVSYCGVLLRDEGGAPFGALCHFDMLRAEVPIEEIPLMEAAAPLLLSALRREESP